MEIINGTTNLARITDRLRCYLSSIFVNKLKFFYHHVQLYQRILGQAVDITPQWQLVENGSKAFVAGNTGSFFGFALFHAFG